MRLRIATFALLMMGMLLVALPACDSSEDPQEAASPGTPTLKADTEFLSLNSEEQLFTIHLTIENPRPEAELTWKCNASWIEAEQTTPPELRFRALANDGQQRTTTLRLIYPGAKILPIEISQAAQGELSSPVIRVEKSTYNLSAAEEDISIQYSILNPLEGGKLEVSHQADWIHLYAIDESDLSMLVKANDANQERTTTLTLSYPEAKPVTITLKQAGKENTDPDPDPDPDPKPNEGKVYRTGWPELCVEDDTNSDYYYAHHITDLKMKGNSARNYTVCYSASHHCPVWVAAPRHSAYEGSTKRTDAYAKDPQIPSNIQYHSKSTGGGCNKGHMLGSAERTASTTTNKQVFYYTNIAPQYSSGFNTGGGGWNTLEDWMDGQVCADTTYLVIGTYFEKYTDGYGETASPKKIEFGDRDDVSCPTMFYIAALRTKRGNTGKSVLDCSTDELKCAAFVRTHTNNHKGQKVTAREMMSIADLEKLTGHKFFVNVPNAPKQSFSASEWGL